MGLFDSIKGIAETVSSVSSVIKGNPSEKNTNDEPALPDKTVENGVTTINTLDGMSSFLQEMQGGQCTPSAMQALQSQIQVLNFVKSPALTGMAVDTMVMCLYKAIQSAMNETERDAVRESFALMIQSFMFFNEAQLQYEINSNKEEGIQLLTQAGDILSKSVVSVATLVATGGAATAASVGNIVVKNVFAKQNGQQGFFGKLIAFIGDKKRIKEKKEQHFDSLKNTFTVFDRYAELIGPSIVLHGMLERYGKKLIDKFEEDKYKYLLVSLGKGADLDSAVNDFIENPFNALDNKKKTLTGYDYIMYLRNKALEKLNEIEEEFTNRQKELENLQTEYNNTSSIKLFQRNELKQKIENQERLIKSIEERLQAARKEMAQADLIAGKASELKPDIDAYTAKINSIVDKFAFNFSSSIGLSSATPFTPNSLMSPPPAPNQSMYNISVNGQTSGPFSIPQLQAMVAQGTIDKNTYVWAQGMPNWEQAGNIQELSHIFGSIPPPPPSL